MRGTTFDKYQHRDGDARIDAWLWLTIRSHGVPLSSDSFNRKDVRQYLIDSTIELHVNTFLKVAERRILPLNELEWITSDDRQINWLISYIRNMLHVTISFKPPGLYGRDLVITLIDLYDVELDDKSSAVAKINWDWNEYIKSDVIFKWFEGKEEAIRCEFAWEWLVDNKRLETQGKAPISSRKGLLMFFDAIGVNDAQKKLDVAAIKRKWSQQKYRAGMKGKSQYNFVLSDRAIADLDKLAKQYEATRPQIIEALIEMEAAQGHYLRQKAQNTSLN